MDWAFTKPSTVRPRFLPYHAYPTYYSIVHSGQNSIITSEVKSIIITELQLNLQKHINICCCSFSWVSMKWKKTVLQENFDLTKNFDLMINFDFFDLITWDFLMVWAWNLVCWRFVNFHNRKKILTLLTFGCPSDNWAITTKVADLAEILHSSFTVTKAFQNQPFSGDYWQHA